MIEDMPTRADFDAALSDLGTAIEAAIKRVAGGASLTDEDIATLKTDTEKINSLAGGVAPTGGGVDSLSFSPTHGTGGTAFTGTIKLAAVVSAEEAFALSSDAKDVSVPGSAVIPVGALSVDFSVSTVTGGSAGVVTITAKSPTRTLTGTFELTA